MRSIKYTFKQKHIKKKKHLHRKNRSLTSKRNIYASVTNMCDHTIRKVCKTTRHLDDD